MIFSCTDYPCIPRKSIEWLIRCLSRTKIKRRKKNECTRSYLINWNIGRIISSDVWCYHTPYSFSFAHTPSTRWSYLMKKKQLSVLSFRKIICKMFFLSLHWHVIKWLLSHFLNIYGRGEFQMESWWTSYYTIQIFLSFYFLRYFPIRWCCPFFSVDFVLWSARKTFECERCN